MFDFNNHILKKKAVSAVLLVSLAMVFYGISFPVTRTALIKFQPITIITLRLALSAIILMIVNFISYGVHAGLPQKEDLPKFFLVGFFQPFLYFLFETYGLKTVSATISSIIISTIPLFTPIFTRVILKEKVSANPVIGILVSFSGVIMLVVFSSNFSEQNMLSFSLSGIILLFGAVFSAVIYTIIVRKIPIRYSPLTITANQNFFGFLFFLPLFIISDSGSIIQYEPEITSMLSIIFLAVFSSTLAFIFLNHGIQVLGPSKTNGLINLIPIVTALISFFFFGEKFNTMKILSMSVVLVGVGIGQIPKSFMKNELDEKNV